MEKDKLCIAFSGGRTSAFMTKWCIEKLSDKYEILVVFANTGKERVETLDFIKKCDDYFGFNVVWVEAVTNMNHGVGVTAKIVDYETASRNGEPFEAHIAKHGMPNQSSPHCSRDLKAYAIKALLKDIGWKKYYTAIGIRADEPSRLNFKKAKKERIIYPLATMIHTTKSNINYFWSKQPFDLTIKSYEGNCDLCWKKSYRKLMTIAIENPQLTDWWRQMEQKYENYIPKSRSENELIKLPIRFFRENQTIDDLIEESKFDFNLATDESKIIDNQMSMWDEHLDQNFGCVESCEPFGG